MRRSYRFRMAMLVASFLCAETASANQDLIATVHRVEIAFGQGEKLRIRGDQDRIRSFKVYQSGRWARVPSSVLSKIQGPIASAVLISESSQIDFQSGDNAHYLPHYLLSISLPFGSFSDESCQEDDPSACPKAKLMFTNGYYSGFKLFRPGESKAYDSGEDNTWRSKRIRKRMADLMRDAKN